VIASVVRERGELETDVARQWWSLPPSTLIPLADGQRCLVLYTGHPGGPAGPDVRDAVLCFLPRLTEAGKLDASSGSGDGNVAHFELDPEWPQSVGAVEFHLRTSDWFGHNHQSDPRYNQVLLHVVLRLDSQVPTRRQDGTLVPTCSLLDLPDLPEQTPAWPCQQEPLAAEAMTGTLLYAGLSRLLAKSQTLQQALTQTRPVAGSPFNLYDTCLLPALAEGLGYGRDRAFFYAVGQRLVGLTPHIPEPLGHTQTPAPLDENRLGILRALSAGWSQTGLWQTLLPMLQTNLDVKSALLALRALFHPLSRARTDIIIYNVVLPFAIAVAERESNPRLTVRAQQMYLAYPRLVSNRVTRIMSAQLQLSAEPEQACLQQGLHHIYIQNCQAKHCQTCLCGGARQ
jgi:hypothetical protein